MMLVLDTNVLVSGILSARSHPGRIIDLIRTAKLTPVVDDRILAEYTEVLHRSYFRRYVSLHEAETMLDFLRHESEYVVCSENTPDLPDPDDAPFLETAVASSTPLITGNLRHFPEEKRRGCTVLTPRQFIGKWERLFAEQA